MQNRLSKKEAEFLKDFASLWEKYKIPERNDVYWESYIKDTKEIADKYENEDFGQIVIPMLVELMSLQQKKQHETIVLTTLIKKEA